MRCNLDGANKKGYAVYHFYTAGLWMSCRYRLGLELIQEMWKQVSITQQLFDSEAKCDIERRTPCSEPHSLRTCVEWLAIYFYKLAYPLSHLHCQVFLLSSTSLCLQTSIGYSCLYMTTSVHAWVALIFLWFQQGIKPVAHIAYHRVRAIFMCLTLIAVIG